jgi:hypothetical protein
MDNPNIFLWIGVLVIGLSNGTLEILWVSMVRVLETNQEPM